jgi:hypothetical protein
MLSFASDEIPTGFILPKCCSSNVISLLTKHTAACHRTPFYTFAKITLTEYTYTYILPQAYYGVLRTSCSFTAYINVRFQIHAPTYKPNSITFFSTVLNIPHVGKCFKEKVWTSVIPAVTKVHASRPRPPRPRPPQISKLTAQRC